MRAQLSGAIPWKRATIREMFVCCSFHSCKYLGKGLTYYHSLFSVDSKTDSKTGRQQWISVDSSGHAIGFWSGWKTLYDYSHFFAVRWTHKISVKSFSHAQNQRVKGRAFWRFGGITLQKVENGRISLQKVRKNLLKSVSLRGSRSACKSASPTFSLMSIGSGISSINVNRCLRASKMIDPSAAFTVPIR